MNHHRFAHSRLDVHRVLLEALVLGDRIVRQLPRGSAPLGDQLRRALLGAYLQTTEAAAREGADRKNRFRIARAECNESAAAAEAVDALRLVTDGSASQLLALLDRAAAMLSRLGGFAD